MKNSLITLIAIALLSMANAQGFKNPEANHVLNRFLRYVKIESQSIDDPDPESFPMTEGQKEMANLIFNELKTIDKDNVLDIKMSPNYFVYVKVPSNIEKEVPSVMFMAHMDVTPEANAKGIRPQVHSNYDGVDIALDNGLVLSPNNPEGGHLKDVVGKTIITTDGERFKADLDEAYRKTLQAYPFVEIDLENDELQYENIAYTMHPQAVGVIQRAAEKTGIPMKGFELRAGTTSASMVAKGLPGGPCLYGAQQASHSVYEWCCLEEILEIIELTSNIVTEVSHLE